MGGQVARDRSRVHGNPREVGSSVSKLHADLCVESAVINRLPHFLASTEHIRTWERRRLLHSRLLCSEELQLSVDVISTSKAAVAWSCSLQLAYAMTSKLTLVMGGGRRISFLQIFKFCLVSTQGQTRAMTCELCCTHGELHHATAFCCAAWSEPKKNLKI